MRKAKAIIAVLLSISLFTFTACGADSSAAEKNENIVVVDFGNIDYSEDPVSTNTAPVKKPSQTVSSEETVSEDESQLDNEEESETESSEAESESNTSSKPKTERKPLTGIPASLDWFDDCVFIGDSLILGLSLYNDYTGDLGSAEFICAAGLNWHNCQWDIDDPNNVHPFYKGEQILLEDSVMLTGANKVIIGMGMNDIGIYGVDDTMIAARDFINILRSKTPDVQIYIQTVTPMIPQKEYDRLNNDLIRDYNVKIKNLADEMDCRFIDSYSAVVDENGELPYDLCEDPNALGLHLNNEGCEIWADCIIRSVY